LAGGVVGIGRRQSLRDEQPNSRCGEQQGGVRASDEWL